MLEFRNQYSNFGYVLLIIWLCIECGDGSSGSIPLKLSSLNFEQIKRDIISASGIFDKKQNLSPNDLKCLKELKAIDKGLQNRDMWALKSKFQLNLNDR